MSEHPVGTGPFRVAEHVLGKYIRLERNTAYFSGGPKANAALDKVEIRFVPDAQTRVAEAVAGGVDLIMNVAHDQAEQLRGSKRLNILAGGTTRYEFLQLNTLPNTPAPQLRDIRVRRAIMHAIDREAIAKFIIGDGAQVIDTECFQGQLGCDAANIQRYDYDPAEARQLLADAGYPRGFALDLYASRNRNESEAIIGYLRAAGIRANLHFMQYMAVQSMVHAGKVALNHSDWGSSSIADVSYSVSVFHEFSPDDVNRDTEIRDLLLHGDSSIDPMVRKDAYAKAFRMIADRAYTLPLYALPTYYVAAAGLTFDPPPDELPRFYEMSWK